MPSPVVQQSYQTPKDKNCLEIVSYMFPPGFRKNVVAMRLHNYPDTADVNVIVNGDKNANLMQSLFKKYEIASEIKPAANTMIRQVVIKNQDKVGGLIKIASIIGMPDEHDISINRKIGMQIIDHELTRTGRTPSGAGLVVFATNIHQHKAFGRTAPHPYLQVEIKHPLSLATYLDEDDINPGRGTKLVTKIGALDAKATTAIVEWLKLAGIDVDTPPRGKPQDSIIAHAAIDRISDELGSHDLIPASLAAEIVTKAAAEKSSFAARIRRHRQLPGSDHQKS